jgi:hypothetical protein
MKKIKFEEPSSFLPGVSEVKEFHKELRYIAVARKILLKRKQMEQKAAPYLKRIMQFLHLGGYTWKVRRIHNALMREEWIIFQRARELAAKCQFAPNNEEFVKANTKLNNFCLGVAAFDHELSFNIEIRDEYWSKYLGSNSISRMLDY